MLDDLNRQSDILYKTNHQALESSRRKLARAIRIKQLVKLIASVALIASPIVMISSFIVGLFVLIIPLYSYIYGIWLGHVINRIRVIISSREQLERNILQHMGNIQILSYYLPSD